MKDRHKYNDQHNMQKVNYKTGEIKFIFQRNKKMKINRC